MLLMVLFHIFPGNAASHVIKAVSFLHSVFLAEPQIVCFFIGTGPAENTEKRRSVVGEEALVIFDGNVLHSVPCRLKRNRTGSLVYRSGMQWPPGRKYRPSNRGAGIPRRKVAQITQRR